VKGCFESIPFILKKIRLRIRILALMMASFSFFFKKGKDIANSRKLLQKKHEFIKQIGIDNRLIVKTNLRIVFDLF
jgi:hypothetical protein